MRLSKNRVQKEKCTSKKVLGAPKANDVAIFQNPALTSLSFFTLSATGTI
jgi:hypothetical protein